MSQHETDISRNLEPDAGNGQRWKEDPEVVYYEGRPTIRADQGSFALTLLLAGALVLLPIAATVLQWGWPWWAMVLSLLGALLLMAWPMIRTWSIRYRISSYRIDVERGVLVRRIDTLELWHVDDISFEQGIVDRLMNVGSIIVESNDKSTPRVVLHGVPGPREVFNSLKQRIVTVKRQRGVIKIDAG